MKTPSSENTAADPVVSVVIPIYKVERYLAQCVESVLSQTLWNIEVILVDDGSPDACPAIADGFAARDSRVAVIHQANQGLSGARNAGLRRATGRFVVFLDSDDFLEGHDSLAQCLAVMQSVPDVDVLFFDTVRFREGTAVRISDLMNWRPGQDSLPSADALRHMIENDDVRPTAWAKVIRRQFLIDNGLDFRPGIYSEDIEWFLRLVSCPARFSHAPVAAYVWRTGRPGSITNTIGRRNVEDLLDTLLIAAKRVSTNGTSNCFKRDYLSYCCYQYTIALAFYAGLERTDRKGVRPRVREAQFLLAFDDYRKSKVISWLVRIIGLEATALLLHTYLVLRARRNRSR